MLRSLSVIVVSFVFFGCAGAQSVAPGPGTNRVADVSSVAAQRPMSATPKRIVEDRPRPALERPRFSAAVFNLKAKGCR
jgi:hypothetical protein